MDYCQQTFDWTCFHNQSARIGRSRKIVCFDLIPFPSLRFPCSVGRKSLLQDAFVAKQIFESIYERHLVTWDSCKDIHVPLIFSTDPSTLKTKYIAVYV